MAKALSRAALIGSVRSLNLSGRRVKDLSSLKSLPALQSLDLTFTKVKDLSPLKNLRALRSLLLIDVQSLSDDQEMEISLLRKRGVSVEE